MAGISKDMGTVVLPAYRTSINFLNTELYIPNSLALRSRRWWDRMKNIAPLFSIVFVVFSIVLDEGRNESKSRVGLLPAMEGVHVHSSGQTLLVIE
jgi:hypothetical protein